MKRSLYLVLSSLVIIAMCLSGCGEKKQAEESQIEKSSAESAAPEKVIELKFNDWNPAGIKATDLWNDVVKQVAEKTNGRIKITNYLSGSLLKFPETFKGVSSGVADISYYLMGGAPGVHVLNEVFDLPFLGFKDYQQAMRVYDEILSENPELQAENEAKGVHMLSIRPMLPYHLHSIKKALRAPADMKGEKVIATGFLGYLATTSGGIAMQSGPPDWYSSLQKGVVQHQITHFVAVEEFKLSELLKTHTIFGNGGLANSGMAVLINLDTWNSLSAEDQAVLVEAYTWYQQQVAQYDIETQGRYIEKMKAEGHQFVDLTPEQIQQWKDVAGKAALDKWLAETEAKGVPGRKIYDAIQAKIAADQ